MEAASEALSRGFLSAAFSDADKARQLFPVPVLQCLHIKQIASSAPGAERYRMVLNDGEHYLQAIIAASSNYLIRDDVLKRGSIFHLHEYTANTTGGRNIIFIMKLDVIQAYGELEKIGEPITLPATATAETATTTISGNDFYGAKKEESKPQPMASHSAYRNTAPGGGNVVGIEGISPYSPKWTIKARVTSKSPIKTWHKANGEGKLFSVNLLDETEEIKATGFNEQCDAFYELLQEGSVYYISSPAKVSMAKKQFSNLKNEYEIIFERDTVIEKAEDQSSVPQIRFNFCNIQDLQSVEKDSTIDIIGVLYKVGDVDVITSKKQQQFSKRELTIVDDTSYSVRVTIWGTTAESFDSQLESIIAFKGTKVSDFGGRSLSLLSSGTMTVNPDVSDAHRLKGWYDSTGRNDNFANHTSLSSMGNAAGRNDELKTMAQIKNDEYGLDKTTFYKVKATIVFVKQDGFCYPACAKPPCNKKVTDMGDGTWRCDSCDSSFDRPNYRYIMSLNMVDHTSNQWHSCFDEAAVSIMGMPANELVDLQQNDVAAFKAAFDAVNCKAFTFTCRAKMESYNDVERVRYQVFKAHPIDFKTDGEKLAEMIEKYNING